MEESEKEELIEKIEKESSTVGHRIPDSIVIQGEKIQLQDFIFEISNNQTVQEDEEIQNLKQELRQERNKLVDKIKQENISRSEGERIAELVIGIDRALNALESLDEPDISTQIKRKEAMDTKRWREFVRKVKNID